MTLPLRRLPRWFAAVTASTAGLILLLSSPALALSERTNNTAYGSDTVGVTIQWDTSIVTGTAHYYYGAGSSTSYDGYVYVERNGTRLTGSYKHCFITTASRDCTIANAQGNINGLESYVVRFDLFVYSPAEDGAFLHQFSSPVITA
jgi:hypothetical protein